MISDQDIEKRSHPERSEGTLVESDGRSRRVLRVIISAGFIIAGVVFLLTPVHSFVGLMFLIGSVILFLLCLYLWHRFDLGDNGYWPAKPTE